MKNQPLVLAEPRSGRNSFRRPSDSFSGSSASTSTGSNCSQPFSPPDSFDNGVDQDCKPAPYKSAIWPLEFCACCPPIVRSFFPGTWQKIQDWTHFFLLIGMIGSLTLVGLSLFHILGEKRCHTNCAEEILIVLSVVPCMMYIMKTIGTYDEQIQEKERAIFEKKKELSQSYDSLINSMDDLLGKAAESSATMAERSFESKRRDFQRFLERAETRYTQIAGTKIDTEMMLQQFRRFVQRWLVVFEECSVDPIDRPKRVVSEDELNKCRTIGDLASLTLERLKATEVRFISSQRDKDAKMLRGFRAQVKKITDAPKKISADSRNQVSEIELTARDGLNFKPKTRSFEEDLSDSEKGGSWEKKNERKLSGQDSQGDRCCACEWFQVGHYRCGCSRSSSENGFPRFFQLYCCRIVLLSRVHAMLMMGFVCAAAIVALEVVYIEHLLPAMTAGAVAYGACLMVLLVRFEQIDIIQRLEREVNELTQEKDRIGERKEQMVTFWNSMQQLTDLWVHRTVPRLDLLKEVQGHLEDAPPEDVLALMAGANTRLEDLENHLPELSLWRGDGELTEDSKKAFAERIERLCHEEKLPKILHGLNKVIEERILTVDGDNPAIQGRSTAIKAGSFSGSFIKNPAIQGLGPGSGTNGSFDLGRRAATSPVPSFQNSSFARRPERNTADGHQNIY